MKDANQEIIRRVLSNVLSRLEGNDSLKDVEPAANESSPVVFIVLNNYGSGGEDNDRNAIRVSFNGSKQSETLQAAGNPATANHPELERFAPGEGKPDDLAPKKCFMEPDRVCVNSGACEMRGF